MKITKYIPFMLILSIAFCVHGDCGCNKIERSELTIEKSKAPAPDDKFQCTKPIESQILNYLHHDNDMVRIDDGDYLIGTNEPIFQMDHELTEQSQHTNGFFIDKYEVSNAEFGKFVDDTAYVTYAEQFGDSFVFQELLSEPTRELYNDFRVQSAPWWIKVNKTFWRQPEGDGSAIDERMNHPVVHVSWFDAQAFCKWKHKRLPTEIEWEIACRGGKKSKLFPWGNKLMPGNKHW